MKNGKRVELIKEMVEWVDGDVKERIGDDCYKLVVEDMVNCGFIKRLDVSGCDRDVMIKHFMCMSYSKLDEYFIDYLGCGDSLEEYIE